MSQIGIDETNGPGGAHGGDAHGGHGESHGHKGHGGGHGGGEHEEHEGAPEWLISFADNVTLMMGFFVILLAMNMNKPDSAGGGAQGEEAGEEVAASDASDQMLDLVLAVREAFNNPVQMGSEDPRDAMLIARMRAKRGQGDASDPGPEGRHRNVQIVRPSDYFGLGGLVPFERGSVQIDEEGKLKIQEIIGHVRGMRLAIQVRGHCSTAEAVDLSDRGMQLAYQRAEAVAKALIAGGIGWDQLTLSACGDNEGVSDRQYDEVGQRSNQRVEVIVSSDVLPEVR